MHRSIKKQSNGSYSVLIGTKSNTLSQWTGFQTCSEAEAWAEFEVERIKRLRRERKRRQKKEQKARQVPYAVGCEKVGKPDTDGAEQARRWGPGDADVTALERSRQAVDVEILEKTDQEPAMLPFRALRIFAPPGHDAIAYKTSPTSKYHTLRGLRTRGWTPAMVRRFLPEPDRVCTNPNYHSAGRMRLYQREKVYALEQQPDVRDALGRVKVRAEARLESVALRMNAVCGGSSIALLDGVVNVPDDLRYSNREAMRIVKRLIKTAVVYDTSWDASIRSGGDLALAIACHKVLEAVGTKYPSLRHACVLLYARAQEHVMLRLIGCAGLDATVRRLLPELAHDIQSPV